jgi:hypothetical protein
MDVVVESLRTATKTGTVLKDHHADHFLGGKGGQDLLDVMDKFSIYA